MPKAVIVCLAILGAALVVGAVIVVVAIRRAPHGYEDRDGFHRGDKPP